MQRAASVGRPSCCALRRTCPASNLLFGAAGVCSSDLVGTTSRHPIKPQPTRPVALHSDYDRLGGGWLRSHGAVHALPSAVRGFSGICAFSAGCFHEIAPSMVGLPAEFGWLRKFRYWLSRWSLLDRVGAGAPSRPVGRSRTG
jgi:hypothetical protein